MKNKLNDILEKYINPKDYKLDMCSRELIELINKDRIELLNETFDEYYDANTTVENGGNLYKRQEWFNKFKVK